MVALPIASGMTIDNSTLVLGSNNNMQVNLASFSGILSVTTGINAQSVANTAIYTVPAGKTAIITGVVIRCTAATSITIGPSLGIGNAAGTNNIFASATITALTTTSTIFGFELVGMSVLTAAAGVIYLNLGTGSTGTSQTIACDLIGYIF